MDNSNLKYFFKNKKILITGHSGFKGSWLSHILLSWGANVVGLSLKPATKPNLFSLLKIKPRIKDYVVDVRNLNKVKAVMKKEKPEIVFHLAAQAIVRDSYDDPVHTFETNVMGTANILEAIRNVKGVRSAVMITTDKVYYNKEDNVAYEEDDKLGGYDPYSGSKASAELVIDSYIRSFFNPKDNFKTSKTLVASARAGNVIGGGDWSKDRIMTDIVRSVFEHGKKISIRNPEAVRPWQFVLEPLFGYLALAKNLYQGKNEFSGAWNFGPNEESHMQVKELLNETFNHLGTGSYAVVRDLSKHEATLLKLNSAKAERHLGWQSTFNALDALKLTLDWYKNYYSGGDVIKFTDKQIKSFFNEL